MSRPFPNTFDKDSPLSPQSASSNISYRADINRQKTKKWTQAPAANYDGDDWGSEDDYGAPPPPVGKPTGLRQQGQAAPAPLKPESSTADSSKKYGELPPLPGASNPRGRANSFDADDEKRDFSSNTVQQATPATATGPATRFSQITGVPATRNSSGPPALSIATQPPRQPSPTGPRKPSQVVSPVSGSPHPDILKTGRVGTGDVVSPQSDTRTPSSSGDYQARRDFSPSAIPPPLTTHPSPTLQTTTDLPAARFPPRKSSISKQTSPPLADIMPRPTEEAASKPWTSGRSASPARIPTTPDKALPFIRPADIYRARMEEQREKERQSLDSSRPSLDSEIGTKAGEITNPVAKAHLGEKTSSDSLGDRSRLNLEGDYGSDSGRRVLEPVPERKSEYGFEGLDAIRQGLHQNQQSRQPQEPSVSEGHQLEVQRARADSTSPKLPDLTRMSGFGIDMFSMSKPEFTEAPLSKPAETTSTTASTLNVLSTPVDDLTLRNQPSLGFRSAVHQAFDTSLPATPASRSGSGVRRTDSESTGTTGISPIMSRVPSTAHPEIRNQDSLVIPEIITEPTTPEAHSKLSHAEEAYPESYSQQETRSFMPGHRRDISTPSPGNSPARIPDLSNAYSITTSQQPVVADATGHPPFDSEKPLQLPRPLAEREQSFRPNLPGGWTSYATTNRSATPVQDIDTHTPTSHQSPVEDNLDITPTATERSLPDSALSAATTGAAIISDSNNLAGEHTPPRRTPSPEKRDLPTPDLSMAPSGNLYSTNIPDPRLMPKLEQAHKGAQLRPTSVDEAVSANYSTAPPPPPKDTPNLSSNDTSRYFPDQIAPLKHRSGGAEVATQPPMRPFIDTNLSTDSQPYDDPNDKLRKEIVKSLSPKPSGVASQYTNTSATPPDDVASGEHNRESTYLPEEYGDYWADTDKDEEPVQESGLAEKAVAIQSELSTPVAGKQALEPSEPSEPSEPAVLPLYPHKFGEHLEASRPQLQNRFSWEGGPVGEQVNKDSSLTPSTTKHDVSESNPRAYTEEEPQPAQSHQSVGISSGADERGGLSTFPNVPPMSGNEAHSTSYAASDSHGSQNPAVDDHKFRNATFLAGAAAVGGATSVALANHSQNNAGRRLSLAEEKDPRVSSYPVSPTPPEDEHPANSPQRYFSPTSDRPTQPTAPSTVSSLLSPVTPHASSDAANAKLLSFREIVGIKSSQERIQTFDDTRRRFAGMEIGLENWMSNVKAHHPEHADATGFWAGPRMTSTPVGSARSRVGATQPPQPYYQQYLNASSPTTPSTPNSRPGPGFDPSPMGGSQQGPSSGGSKLAGNQVSAKGKEFLHTAGVFGGKAGKAGKGLFAKSKNKLRGAGGGDKMTDSDQPSQQGLQTQSNQASQSSQSIQSIPTPKAKTDRRTSWGLPLSLTRSSGKQESANNDSRESTPSGNPRTRASTLSSDNGPTPPQHSALALTPEHTMSGALPSHSGLQQHPPVETTIRQGQDEEKAAERSEERGDLNVPAPIGKNQPSWDPFNATPIAEEEAFQYEDRNEQKQNVSDTRHMTLSVPVVAKTTSERSNSEDAQFYDANEDPSDIPNDWVIVSPDTEVKDSPATQATAITHVATSETEHSSPQTTYVRNTTTPEIRPKSEMQAGSKPEIEEASFPKHSRKESLEPPVTSILDRPRGSYEYPSSPLSANSTNVGAAVATRAPSSQSFQNPYQYPPSEQQVAGSRPSYRSSAPLPPPSQTIALPSKTEPERQSTSFLPPIRRTSTFGLGFGSRQSKPRFPIDDDDDEGLRTPAKGTILGHESALLGAAAVGTAGIAAVGNRQNQRASLPAGSEMRQSDNPYQPPPPISQQNVSHQQGPSFVQPSHSPAPFVPKSLQDQRQRAPIQPQPMGQPFHTPQPGDILQQAEFKESHVEWRQARPKTNAAPQVPASYYKETGTPNLTRSETWDPQQHQRTYSGSSQSFVQRPEVPSQARPFEQPPSAAQRYPGLFKSGSEQPPPESSNDPKDLPDQYYQAPIPREAAFLPRQQTNEYQLPGVGPPEDPRTTGGRRNSGFFKEIGGKISRASSRSRGNSVFRDEAPSARRPSLSRGHEDESAESIATSEDSQSKNKRRTSFFGNLSRSSTGGIGPPQSRESTIAHNPGSRVDQLVSGQPSPAAQQDRKRSFFGNLPSDQKPKPNKLARASTGQSFEDAGKKKRFSGLTGLFAKQTQPARASPLAQPQVTRELAYNERQPLESSGSALKQQMGFPQHGLSQVSYTPPPGPPPGRSQAEHVPPRGPPLGQAKATSNQILFLGPPAQMKAYEDYTPPQGPPPNRAQALASFTPPPNEIRQNFTPPAGPQQTQVRMPSTATPPPSQVRAPSSQTSSGLNPNLQRAHTNLLPPGSHGQHPPGQVRAPDNQTPPPGFHPDQASAQTKFSPPRPQTQSPQGQQPQAVSQSRNLLAKLTPTKGASPSPQPESKPRKSSTSGLLGGLIGRRSHQDNRRDEESRSLGNQQPIGYQQQHQQQAGTQQSSRAQSQQPSVHTSQPGQSQGPPGHDDERGRRVSREPQYDNVPIPSGYTLVRGHGATAVPAEYDPRGLRNLQQDPRYRQVSGGSQLSQQGPVNGQQYGSDRGQQLQPSATIRQVSSPSPGLSPDIGHDQRSAPRRLSREDMLARSPPKSPEGQQRPYQLTLPGEVGRPAPISKDSPNFPLPPANQTLNSPALTKQLDPVQRLQQPTVRHPESPAGYPLPEDTVFSPVNEQARNFPDPPPPQWPAGQESRHATNLDRSNTHRTAISALSGISDHSPKKEIGSGNGSEKLGIPGTYGNDGQGGVSSPSPTPPSPLPRTPERGVSPEVHDQTPEPKSQTAVSDIHRNASDDLYDASPKLPKGVDFPGSSLQNGSASHQTYQNGQSSGRVGGKENLGPQQQHIQIPEEKILADEHGGRGEVHELEDSTTAMSATSYPGQEWNPYGAGGWEED